MMFRGDGGQGELNGFLDGGSHLQGELRFEDTFRVDGQVNGKVVSSGDLVVGEGGVVEGEIAVGKLFVSGTLRGTVKAAIRVEITAGGRVEAEIETPSLVIEDGAFFEGGCLMQPSEASRRAETIRGKGVVAPMPLTKES